MRIEQMEVEFAGNPNWYKIGFLSSRLDAVLIPSALGSPRGIRWSPAVRSTGQRILERLCHANQSPNAVAELDDLAIRLGLDNRSADDSVALRERLVALEQKLISQLERLQPSSISRDQLHGRKRDISHRLEQLRSMAAPFAASVHYDSRLTDRLSAIDADLRGAQEEIEHCDRELTEVKARIKVAELDRKQIELEPSYRQQLQKLEDRLERWRQTLRDIKSHRESIESSAVDAHLDEQVAQQLSPGIAGDARAPMRSLESQLHHARQQVDYLVAQYATGQFPNGHYATNHYATNHYTAKQHANGQQQSMDGASTMRPMSGGTAPGYAASVTGHSTKPLASHSGYYVHQDPSGRTHIAYHTPEATPFSPGSLPELLQSMQRDLHEVCNQLSHQEARSAATALQQQVQQLKRCETELLQSVQRLIDQRAVLLRKIADKYHLTSDQVSLAFGDWCQCSDHTHLREWLLDDERNQRPCATTEELPRTQLLERLARLESQRKKALLRAEECRRQLREADRSRSPRATVHAAPGSSPEEIELVQELDHVTSLLADMENRERLVAELDDVRHQLQRLPTVSGRANEFQQSVHKHIMGLSGSLYRQFADPHTGGVDSEGDSNLLRQLAGVSATWLADSSRIHYDVPSGVVVAAQNLAIVESLETKGELLPVVLYQALDVLAPEALNAAVAYLSWFSNHHPVILMTRDSRVADAVRRQGGQCHRLNVLPQPELDVDVNQQLAAYANEEEAAKWYKPGTASPERPFVRQYYLSEYSAIEELTAVPSKWLDRLQYLGINRVGDLLDADPLWLSDQLSNDKANSRMVRSWQAIAELLCSVRGLRPFDARVLVGAGVNSAEQLCTLHPAELLDRVESFLATEKGRRILQSGNRYELTRITSWIAAAKSGSTRSGQSRASHRARRRYRHPGFATSHGHSNMDSHRDHRTARQTSRRQSLSPVAARRTHATSVGEGVNPSAAGSAAVNGRTAESTVRFYLDLTSPVIDAPSIGSRMSERLRDNGVHTVEQLILANPESLARRIAHRRVSPDTVRAWQLQARLVCQIPYLRGHDAQLLVACDITSPEKLSDLPAKHVLEKVLSYARTPEGQRTLRGNKQPDLEEVEHWIQWARQYRNLNAA